MKKVRYAAGALGALGVMSALGLVTPAAAAATQAPARTGKTVSLVPATTRPCDARSIAGASPDFIAGIKWSRDIGCIGEVFGQLISHHNAGLWLRVRSYTNGILVHNRYNKNGVIHNGNNSVTWVSHPFTTGIQQVCEAVITSVAPSRPIFGPVCEQTGFTT